MTWTDTMNELCREFSDAEYDARVLAIHAQMQAALWHEEATCESQREAALWHEASRRRFDAWSIADDRVRAMRAAAASRRELVAELNKWVAFADECRAAIGAR